MKPGFSVRSILMMLVTLVVFTKAFAWHPSVLDLKVKNKAAAPESEFFRNYSETSKTSGISESKLAPASITLIVTHYQLRIGKLSWITSTPTEPGTFHIERNDGVSGWVELASIPYTAPLTYEDTISFPYCTPTHFLYRILFISALGQPDVVSGPASADLSDLTSPADVANLNVTLMQTTSGFVPRVTWEAITNDSISYYEIGRYNGFKWPAAGTANADSGAFTDNTLLDGCVQSYKYVIRTFDKCGNNSNPDYKLAVQTIMLSVQQPGKCDKSAKLTWNRNKNIPGGTAGFKIYRSDGNNPIMVFNVPKTDTTYIDNFNLQSGHTYLYSVTAYGAKSNDTSASCQYVFPYDPVNFTEVNVTRVSVENDSYVQVSYQIIEPNEVKKLVLLRSENQGSGYQPIDSVMVTNGYVQPDTYFNDTTADVHSKSYYYLLMAYDTCGTGATSLNFGRSIFLQCSSEQAQNNLTWNQYEPLSQNNESYSVYRTVNGQPADGEVMISSQSIDYTDPLSGVDPVKMVCYWVTANENLAITNPKSNTCCIIKEPAVFMPNAFYPDGINKYLRPLPNPVFADPQSFELTVFNRWGQQIFKTTDMSKGWDGSITGQPAPAGLYTYLLTYKSINGQGYTKRGTAQLIR